MLPQFIALNEITIQPEHRSREVVASAPYAEASATEIGCNVCVLHRPLRAKPEMALPRKRPRCPLNMEYELGEAIPSRE
jgi:hypothetical protein